MKYLLQYFLFLIGTQLVALTLPEALEELQKNNTTVQISQKQIEKSQQKLEQKRAIQYGTISGFSAVTKYNNERTLAPLAPPIAPNVPTSDTLTTLGINYSVTLFSGFKDSSQIELSNISTKIEQTKHKLTLSQLEFNVQSLFCDILSLEKTLLSWEKYQESIKKLYQFSQKEFELGKKSQLELLKIESDLQQSNSIVIDLQTKIDILQHSLSILIYGKKKYFTLEDIDFEKKTSNFSIENILKIDLASLATRTKEKSLQSFKSTYYPKITLNTNYSNIYGDGEKENITTSSINLVWNFYDFGSREALIQEAKIEQIQAKLELEKTKEEIMQAIFEAQKQIEKNKQLLQSASINLKLSEKTKQIEDILYKEGQKDITDYLLALAKYSQSEANLITTQYALLKSKYYFNSIVKE